MSNLELINPRLWEKWKIFVNTNFGIDVSEDAINKFNIYLKELIEWNNKFNLVSFKSEEEILWRHFSDSISAVRIFRKLNCLNPKIIDIGAGAGFPGIPIKIIYPTINLTIVESITKKTLFLESLIINLLLNNTEILNQRAETLAHKDNLRSKYDIALLRAVSSVSTDIELALPFVKTGGYVLIYKSQNRIDAETKHAANALKLLESKIIDNYIYNFNCNEKKHCILVIKKDKETPKIYPRKPGIPTKRPL